MENYKEFSNKLTFIKKIAKQNYYAHMIQLNKNALSFKAMAINKPNFRKKQKTQGINN